jgi:tetratricopeptide (TPR) repeat protein
MADTPQSSQADDAGEEISGPETYRYNLDSLEEYLATGERVAKEGRLDEAVDVMREAAHRYPESPTGRYNLGVALFLRLREERAHLDLWEDLAGDEQLVEEAIDNLQQAVERDPGFVGAYNNLARLYALRGRAEEAVATWGKSLSIQPEQPEVQAELELYRSKMGPTQQDLEEKSIMSEGSPSAPEE